MTSSALMLGSKIRGGTEVLRNYAGQFPDLEGN
jgi:hypothetical protein